MGHRLKAAAAVWLAVSGIGAWAVPDEADFLYRAPITVQRNAPFVAVPLTPATYGRSLSPALADLRVVDAQGGRVPFALQAPEPGQPVQARLKRAVMLYPLPPRPPASAPGGPAFELELDDGRLRLRQEGAAARLTGPSPGWVVDLGATGPDTAPPAFVELAWSGAADFSTGYRVETSDDLRQWRPAGGGQLMSLAAAGATLTQPLVALPASPGRYLKLEWLAGDAPPPLSGAQAVSLQTRMADNGALTELRVAAAPDTPPAGGPPRALLFDLGAPLPLAEAALDWTAGTHVVPARVQGRLRPDQPWTDLASAVFYRLEREGPASMSPAVPLQATARYLRVLPDDRAGALTPAGAGLRVRAALGQVVFATQGVPPFALVTGAAGVAPGHLPIQALVPSLNEERERFGAGRLGEWGTSAAAEAKARAEQDRAAWRPVLLWGALLVAVAALAAMVWRLARGQPQA